MKICVTEKPSVAQDIANILGATTRHWRRGDCYRHQRLRPLR